MPHRRPLVVLALSLTAIAALHAGRARAQERIPQDAIVAQASFSDTQRQAITGYISRWGGLLQEATTNQQVSDTQISEARQKLLGPLRTPGATDFFKKRYSAQVSQTISGLLDADRLIVRLNAIIVVTRLTDPSAVALAEDEDSTEVLQQVMLAMGAMNLPSALDRLLDLLDARLRWHVDRPYEPYLAEAAGLRSVYQSLLRTPAANPAQIRKLAQVAHRYMNLISRNLAEAADKAQAEGTENPISRELEADHAALLELCEYALQYVHGEVGSQQGMPSSIIQKIPFRNWKEINLIAVDGWGQVLKAPPLNFKPGDLAIVQP